MLISRFTSRMAFLAILSMFTFGVSFAQKNEFKRTISENSDEKYYQFHLTGVGISLWAGSPEAKIYNAQGDSTTLKEVMDHTSNFNVSLPLTVLNNNISITIHDIIAKSKITKEQIAKSYVDYILKNRAEGKSDGHFNLFYRYDDNKNHYATSISFSNYYNNAIYGTTYNNIALADLRYFDAYAVIETSQRADTPIIADSIAHLTSFNLDLVDPAALLTKVQMDSVDDGFEYIPTVMEEMGNRMAAKGDTVDVANIINECAFIYRDFFERYPRTYLATHMNEIREREARYNGSSIMVNSKADKKREEEMRKLTDMSNFNPKPKKIGNATITTSSKSTVSSYDTNVPIMHVNKNGQIYSSDPTKRTQSTTGTYTIKW